MEQEYNQGYWNSSSQTSNYNKPLLENDFWGEKQVLDQISYAIA